MAKLNEIKINEWKDHTQTMQTTQNFFQKGRNINLEKDANRKDHWKDVKNKIRTEIT